MWAQSQTASGRKVTVIADRVVDAGADAAVAAVAVKGGAHTPKLVVAKWTLQMQTAMATNKMAMGTNPASHLHMSDVTRVIRLLPKLMPPMMRHLIAVRAIRATPTRSRKPSQVRRRVRQCQLRLQLWQSNA